MFRGMVVLLCGWAFIGGSPLSAQSTKDPIANLQAQAMTAGRAPWGYWGTDPNSYYDWCNHSNRLIPVYTFGLTLESVQADNSAYRSEIELERLFGRLPAGTLNSHASYFDQTDIFKLQMKAIEAGKKNIILVIFDGLDWHTTRAAAVYRAGRVGYDEGPGTGLRLQDFQGVDKDYGYCVTSPRSEELEVDVNTQSVTSAATGVTGGYDAFLGGDRPWAVPRDAGYLLGWNKARYHSVSDSANAATAIVTGRKTYNGAVNIDCDGQQLQTVAHILQERDFAIGIVTNVPISHATPAAAYAHNVSRLDYQDLSRDLLGVPSASHPLQPLRGVDVLLGAGWGESVDEDAEQGTNFVAGNRYLSSADQRSINIENGGKYYVLERGSERTGSASLHHAAQEAAQRKARLLGMFGVKSGHLPYRTANGDYQPTAGVTAAEVYTAADIRENPTLAEMTSAALTVLSQNPNGFWLMVEAGDVDWASHDVNIDTVLGAVLDGDEAFGIITQWADKNDAWDDTAVVITSDHGHGFVLTDPTAFASAGQLNQ